MIKVSRLAGRCGLLSVLLAVCWFASGCKTGASDTKVGGASDPREPQFASVAPVSGGDLSTNSSARIGLDALHAGDVLTIDFSDLPVLMPPREERIKEDGTINLMEGKTFVAANKTRKQLEDEIHDFYVPRYYLKMTVSIRQKEQTQFYYVRGEVRIPNRQIYISRIRLLQAIASAGDFTDFARKKAVLLTRADGRKLTINCIKARKDPSLNVEILPGDIIDVPRRNPFW